MSIAQYVTEGIGPGSTIPAYVRDGLNQGPASLPPLLVTEGFGTPRGTIASYIREGLSQFAVTQQQVVCTTTSWTGLSLQENQTPPVAVGDTFYADFLTTPGKYNVTVAGDGTVTINASGDQTRQFINANIFDLSLSAFYGAFKVYFNQHAPQINIQPPDIHLLVGSPFSLKLTPLDPTLPRYILDQDNDPMTSTVTVGSLPAGLTLTGSVENEIKGVVTGVIDNPVTIRVSDPFNFFCDVTINVLTDTGQIVPQLIGLTKAAAATALSALGLSVDDQSTDQYNQSVPVGIVFNQNIPFGATVFSGSLILITASLGPQFNVPDVTGLTLASAAATLITAGFIVGAVTTDHSDSVPSGSIISQSIPGGTLTPAGTAVDLVESVGPSGTIIFSVKGNIGDILTFNVAVPGVSPSAYQWYWNGFPIPGATGASYTTDPLKYPLNNGESLICRVFIP